ncbi:diguanylate cyclase [bacterium]|nr:diguanylate cyclase [bacterium]
MPHASAPIDDRRLPTWLLVAFCVFSILALGALDFLTGRDISFAFFYLAPILYGNWLVGKRAGVALAFLSTVVWYLFDFRLNSEPATSLVLSWNALVRISFYLIAVYFQSELVVALRRERETSRRDFLSNIANTRAFFEAIEREFERVRRYGGPMTLISMDVDNFKEVNDELGHQVGDAVIREVGSVLSQHSRATDMPARIGGDEFFVLLPQTGAEDAAGYVRHLLKQLLMTMIRNDFPVTFSMGVATFNELPETLNDVIKMADDLLYRAKRSGKNTFHHEVYPPLEEESNVVRGPFAREMNG